MYKQIHYWYLLLSCITLKTNKDSYHISMMYKKHKQRHHPESKHFKNIINTFKHRKKKKSMSKRKMIGLAYITYLLHDFYQAA